MAIYNDVIIDQFGHFGATCPNLAVDEYNL